MKKLLKIFEALGFKVNMQTGKTTVKVDEETLGKFADHSRMTANLLHLKLDLIAMMSKGTFALPVRDVIERLDRCMASPESANRQ